MITRRTLIKFLAGAVVASPLLGRLANAKERPRFEFNRIKIALDTQQLHVHDTSYLQTGDLFTIEGVDLIGQNGLAKFRITEIDSSTCMTVMPI